MGFESTGVGLAGARSLLPRVLCAVFVAVLALANPVWAANSSLAEAGNITTVDLTVASGTSWHAVYGLITGAPFSVVSVNATPNSMSNITINSGSAACTKGVDVMALIFSTSRVGLISLVPGNLPQLDAFISSSTQSATRTFTTTSSIETASYGTILGTPTVYTSSMNSSTGFQLGYLQDYLGNFFFVTPSYNQKLGFNGTPVDFQLMLPTNSTNGSIYYARVDLSCHQDDDGGDDENPGPGPYFETITLDPVDVYVDTCNDTLCRVQVQRSMVVSETYAGVTTTYRNMGGGPCLLEDFTITDIIPLSFGQLDEVHFSPGYRVAEGSTVVFSYSDFPQQGPGQFEGVFFPGHTIRTVYSLSRRTPLGSIYDFLVPSLYGRCALGPGKEKEKEKGKDKTKEDEMNVTRVCERDLYCEPWGPCIGGYRSRPCHVISNCEGEDFIRTEKCTPGPPSFLEPEGVDAILQKQTEAWEKIVGAVSKAPVDYTILILLGLLLVGVTLGLIYKGKREQEMAERGGGPDSGGRGGIP